jgi:hypothetical protein
MSGDVMSSIDIEHKPLFLLNSGLVEISLPRSITDDHSILIHRLNVLPGVLILEESVVMTFTIWTRLIAVDLSVVEQVCVVVASRAMLHLIVCI